MEQGLVSIITPMYNAKQYIEATMESVIAQTYENWEMLIVDDGSTDGSDSLVEKYQKKDKRIRYIYQDNEGVSAARNRGIMDARGEFLAFLDSDDLWYPKKLEKQVALMREKGIGFSYTACDVIDAKGRLTGKIRQVPERLRYENYLNGNVIPCLTVMLDRKQVGKVEMPKMGHEDYATWLTVMKDLGEAYGINEVLGSYREMKTSLSGNKFKAVKWTWNVYRKSQHLSVWKSAKYLCGHVMQAVRKR